MEPTTAVAPPGLSDSDRPRLARGVRLTFSPARQRHLLLRPESVVVLNGSGASILGLCDGRRTVAEIVAELGARYRAVPGDEVRQFLARLTARRCVEPADGPRPADGPGLDGPDPDSPAPGGPGLDTAGSVDG